MFNSIKEVKGKLFYDSPLNTGRQYEFDIARAVLIFCLAPVHITIECSTDEALRGGIPYLFDTIIGGPFGAPMFIFVMGVGFYYTHNNTFEDHIRRGIKLFFLAYLLNVCRFLIPSLVGYMITGEKEKYMDPLMFKVLGNDILTFAGLALILLGILIRLNVSKKAMILIGIASSAIGNFLNGTDVKNDLGNIFLGYIIGTEDQGGMVVSDFPLLNWFIFPIMGYVFASILVKVRDKVKFYTYFSPICILISMVYFTIGISREYGMFGEGQNCYYHINILDAFATLITIFAILGIYSALLTIIPKKVKAFAVSISKDLTRIYCIHWVIVFVVVDLVIYILRGTQILNIFQILVLALAVTIASIVLAHYYHVYINRRREKNEGK